MKTSSGKVLGHPEPHCPPSRAPYRPHADSSEAPPGWGGKEGEESGEAPPRRGWAKGDRALGTPGAPAGSGQLVEGRVLTHLLRWRRSPPAANTARAAARAPSARTCPWCPAGWCRRTSYQPFRKEEGGGGRGREGGRRRGRKRGKGSGEVEDTPSPTTCTIPTPPASPLTHPPTHPPPRAAAAVQAEPVDRK